MEQFKKENVLDRVRMIQSMEYEEEKGRHKEIALTVLSSMIEEAIYQDNKYVLNLLQRVNKHIKKEQYRGITEQELENALRDVDIPEYLLTELLFYESYIEILEESVHDTVEHLNVLTRMVWKEENKEEYYQYILDCFKEVKNYAEITVKEIELIGIQAKNRYKQDII